ncbi:hypothetical protein Poly51_59420 [Rubripirellula tenax]|uniref:Ice-binding protein C-terminal domain-containing protein n=1 Tax=Rubripirellula tenax TaxID=2528015 RepID=A0A5C6E4T1_9BACT|nr:PEP-CTERM sorting domain-containing protein [Rubripirellula tenax]TWU44673.1 hypothetical protein Poly51_59420 [Rubripirellula tenax]
MMPKTLCSNLSHLSYQLRSFISIAAVLILMAATAKGDLIFSGDFQNGTGNLVITNSITFTLTGDSDSNGFFEIVFDQIVTPDSARDIAFSDTNFAFSRNGNPVTSTDSRFYDNQTSTINDITVGDGFLLSKLDSGLVTGESLTLLAGNYTFGAATGFNPQYNGLTFTGDAFIVRDRDGRRISSIENVSAVPEPGSFTLVGLAIVGFVARRRRVSSEVRTFRHS